MLGRERVGSWYLGLGIGISHSQSPSVRMGQLIPALDEIRVKEA